MKRLGFLLSVAFICLATMGQMTCAGSGEEQPGDDPQGASVVGNPDPELGGSHAGNPEGGSVAQNPVAFRIIMGRVDTIKSENGLEMCQYESIVLVNDELEHVIADVDPEDCAFKTAYPAYEPMALVGLKGHQQEFSVGDLDEKVYQIIGPGPAVGAGEPVKPIDLGMLTVNPVTLRLEPQFPIKDEDLIVAIGSDSDGDGIVDAFDDFNNDWYYGYYEPGQLITNLAPDADATAYFCPTVPETVKVQVRKWTPKPGSTNPNAAHVLDHSNGVEVVIHSIESGKNKKEHTFGTIGTIEAGFIKTDGNKYVGDEIYAIECSGELTHEDPHPAYQLSLRITCSYRPQDSENYDAVCVYWNYVKMTIDLTTMDAGNIDGTKPINQVPINSGELPPPLKPPTADPKTLPVEPFIFE